MRSREIQVLLILALRVFHIAVAQDGHQPKDRMYSKYPVSVTFHEKSAQPNLRYREARAFRTRLLAAAAAGPNFANDYDVAAWGCGSGCLMFALIDARTGKVTFFPHTISQINEKGDKLAFRRDSRALHVIGSLDEGNNSADRWFVWNRTNFELVTQKPAELFKDLDTKP